jgi:hypothetical protein
VSEAPALEHLSSRALSSARVDILVAIDALDDFILESKAVPLTDQVRVDEQRLREAVGRIRTEAGHLFGPSPPPDGPIARVLGVIDELEAVVDKAERVPLRSGQMRVDKEVVYDLLDQLRAKTPDAILESRGETRPAGSLPQAPTRAALDTLAELIYESEQTAFSERLVIDERAVRDASERLRAAVDGLPGFEHARMRALVDELDEMVRTAKRSRLTGRLRVPKAAMYDLLERLQRAESPQWGDQPGMR